MDYSDQSFNAMQADAIRRVREMQQRSRGLIGENSETADNAAGKPDSRPSPPQPAGSAPLFKLGDIKIDQEKAMIGLLIFVLYKQGADIKLLLALGYLLL